LGSDGTPSFAGDVLSNSFPDGRKADVGLSKAIMAFHAPKEASIMRRLFVVLVVVVIGVIALGYYRDWFKFSTASDSKTVNVNVTVDKEKVKEDEEKAKEKLEGIGGQIKEKTKGLTDKVKKEAGEKNPSGDQPR